MGDSVILRNDRRSKSQLSIYDYPEHLNPFYEDENHKRLRFLKIGKEGKEGKEGRRGSFSLGGLRDMWSFKSFRGKKKSSSLGINKTSESPEQLRRTLGQNNSIYATYNPKLQNAYDNGTFNNNFQRNIPTRISLQDIGRSKLQVKDRNDNGLGFTRNDSYRSTIQISGRREEFSGHNTPSVPLRRYVYAGSVTPQPRTKFDHNDSSISRGSSQLSVASSTNPFEDDDDNDSVLDRLESGDSERPTPAQRRARKKRRAPPPPVPIPKVIDEEPRSAPASPTTTTTITTTSQESSPDKKILQRKFTAEEQHEISSIAAEIEHFVKLLTEDEEEESAIRVISTAKPEIEVQPPTPDLKISEQLSSYLNRKGSLVNKEKSGGESRSQQKPLIVEEKKSAGQSRNEKQPIIVKEAVNIENHAETKESNRVNQKVEVIRKNSVEMPIPAARQHILLVNKLIVQEDAESEQRRKTEKPAPLARQYSSTDSEEDSSSGIIRNVDHEILKKDLKSNGFLPNSHQQIDDVNNNFDHRSESSKEQTPLNSSYDTTEERIPVSTELKITESKEDISDISNGSSDRYQIRYVALKDGSSESPPQMRREIKISNQYQQMHNKRNEAQENNVTSKLVPKERRRSVKEIIDSINRSQRLLKVNQDPQETVPSVTATLLYDGNNFNTQESMRPPPRRNSVPKDSDPVKNYRRLSKGEQELTRMMVEMESLTDTREADSYCENVPSILDRFDEELNNNDIFKKCVLKKTLFREGSPTTLNLDWNPLPKPKRLKNFSAEMNNGGSGK